MQTGERRNPLDGIRTGNRNRVDAQLHPTSPAVASKLTTCQSWCPPVSPVLEQARFPPAAARGTELSIVHGNERYYYVYIYYCITIAPAFEGSIAAEFSTRFVFRSFNNKTKKKRNIYVFFKYFIKKDGREREREKWVGFGVISQHPLLGACGGASVFSVSLSRPACG